MTAVLSRIIESAADIDSALKETTRILYNRLPSESGILHTYVDGSRKEIRVIKEYINNHYAEDISVEMAAKEVNMSRSYFSQLFKMHMGMGFTDFVNKVRIAKACEMLGNPSMRIQEIACSVGITNYNYFSILFRKMVGCTPSEYRKNSLNRNEDRRNKMDNCDKKS